MRLRVAVVGALAAVVLLLARPRLEAIRASFRTSSSPGPRAYDALSGLFLSGLYADIAADCAGAVKDVPMPAILEVGPGPGRLAQKLLEVVPLGRWTGLDVDPAMLAAARRRLTGPTLSGRTTFVEGDVAAMPFDDAAFDLVVSSLSAHHWPDAAAGFREAKRVLRPGGILLVYDLPPSWGHVETGSSGIDAVADAFPTAAVTAFRRLGPLAFVRRVEGRRV